MMNTHSLRSILNHLILNHRWRRVLLLLGSCLLIIAPLATSQATQAGGYQSAMCPAQSSWVTSPSLPSKIPASDTNCDFHGFMWQSFIYLMSPTNKNSPVRQFETWMPAHGIFVKAGDEPAPWGSVPDAPFCDSSGKAQPANYQFVTLTTQAGTHQPLIDQNANLVYYSLAVNEPAYDFLTQCDLYKAQCGASLAPDLTIPAGLKPLNIPEKYPHLAFPTSSYELKMSWKILTKAEQESGTFYQTTGTILTPDGNCQKAYPLGLVGMHIVSNPPGHPEFLWATFEHKNNAPNCTDLSAKPPLGGSWNFYNPDCEDCELNTYRNDKPAQICRDHPYGDPTLGVFPDGLGCDATPPPDYICDDDVRKYIIDPNTENLQSLNASVTQMLSQLGNDNPAKLLANYMLVGNVWTLGGNLPPYLQYQRGSLSASNTTMESFSQNGVSGKTATASCFSCHNLDGHTPFTQGQPSTQQVTLPEAGLSHIYNLIQNTSSGCENGTELPKACAVYFSEDK